MDYKIGILSVYEALDRTMPLYFSKKMVCDPINQQNTSVEKDNIFIAMSYNLSDVHRHNLHTGRNS